MQRMRVEQALLPDDVPAQHSGIASIQPHERLADAHRSGGQENGPTGQEHVHEMGVRQRERAGSTHQSDEREVPRMQCVREEEHGRCDMISGGHAHADAHIAHAHGLQSHQHARGRREARCALRRWEFGQIGSWHAGHRRE